MSTRNSYVGLVAAFAAIGCILASSVGARTVIYPLAVKLSGVSPSHGTAGQVVTLSGEHLENTKSVSFGAVAAESYTVDPGGLWVKAVIPAGLPNGPLQITLEVEGINQSIGPFVIGAGGAAPGANPQAGGTPKGVTVGVAPRITKFSPIAGKAGTKVTIRGAHLGKALWLDFGGVKARITVSSANRIVAIVPKHARSGQITVHTKGGTAISRQSFKV